MRAAVGAIIIVAGSVLTGFGELNRDAPMIVGGLLHIVFGWVAVLWRDKGREEP